jgi:hypothetical protein
MPGGERTRPAAKSDSKQYIAKAEEFLASMESALAAELWDAAGLAAIHSGITAADAVLAYHGGVRSAGQDHRVAVDLLKQTMGTDASRAATHLKRLIDKKNLVEYEQRRLIRSEAVDLADHARRFMKWARMQVP